MWFLVAWYAVAAVLLWLQPRWLVWAVEQPPLDLRSAAVRALVWACSPALAAVAAFLAVHVTCVLIPAAALCVLIESLLPKGDGYRPPPRDDGPVSPWS